MADTNATRNALRSTDAQCIKDALLKALGSTDLAPFLAPASGSPSMNAPVAAIADAFIQIDQLTLPASPSSAC